MDGYAKSFKKCLSLNETFPSITLDGGPTWSNLIPAWLVMTFQPHKYFKKNYIVVSLCGYWQTHSSQKERKETVNAIKNVILFFLLLNDVF